jgi:hypothetical protein
MMGAPLGQVVASTLWHIDAVSGGGVHSITLDVSSVKAGDLRRIAPTHLESINLRGTFYFPIERYAHLLLPSVADLNARQRRLD